MTNRIIITSTILTLTFFLGLFQNSYAVAIDTFSVYRDGSLFFQDTFDDGVVPVTGSGSTYIVNGGLGPETGGRLQMENSDQVARTAPGGSPVTFQSALLRTNIDEMKTTAGLKSSYRTLGIIGLFDYTLPEFGESYGVRFSDRTSSNAGNDIIELIISNNGTGASADLRHLNFIDGTVDTIGSLLLDTSLVFDQLHLSLQGVSVGTKAIVAQLGYFNSGAFIQGNTVASTINPLQTLFNGETYTRAQFFSRTTISSVPEPGTLLLLGIGIIGIVLSSRKRDF